MPSAYLWCPAYALTDARHLQDTLGAARRLTAALGLDLHASDRLPLFPGQGCWLSPEERRADLRQGLGSGHDLLIAARGGYGCIDLIDQVLEWPHAAPGLIGYSDVTVLHALWQRRGWGETVYGLMPGVSSGERAFASAVAALRGEALSLSGRECPEVVALNPGTVRGRLFPACLRVLAGLIGTPAMPVLSGCILAIEDIDERAYRVERDMQQLARSGALDGVTALVCGGFQADEPGGYAGPSVQAGLGAWAARLRIPALYALPFGHHPDPLSLPCGRLATLAVAGSSWHLAIEPRTSASS